MNLHEIVTALRALASQIETAAPGQPLGAPTLPAVTFTRDTLGNRIDNVAPTGTPGTVTLPVTGHVLSLPQPRLDAQGKLIQGGEMLVGYTLRVGVQCGATLQKAIDMHGAIAYMESGLKTYGPTPAYWPMEVDEFYNREAYNPVSDADKAAQAKQWADAQQQMRQPPPSDAPPAIIEG